LEAAGRAFFVRGPPRGFTLKAVIGWFRLGTALVVNGAWIALSGACAPPHGVPLEPPRPPDCPTNLFDFVLRNFSPSFTRIKSPLVSRVIMYCFCKATLPCFCFVVGGGGPYCPGRACPGSNRARVSEKGGTPDTELPSKKNFRTATIAVRGLEPFVWGLGKILEGAGCALNIRCLFFSPGRHR